MPISHPVDPDDYAFPQDCPFFVGERGVLYHFCYGVVLVGLPLYHVTNHQLIMD